MIELGPARSHLLKKVLPFALTLFVGASLAGALSHRGHSRQGARGVIEYGVLHNGDRATSARELPEVHVLSPMMMEEVRDFELRGGGYEGARVISPPGPHFAPPPRRGYRQAVLQVRFLFGADGRVSEIIPLDVPASCGVCLEGPNVVRIDPRDPGSSELVEAAVEAVRQISFEPGKLDGQPVQMHGLAECIFRLDEGRFTHL